MAAAVGRSILVANSLSAAEASQLWTVTRARFQQSRNRIRLCRRWLANMVEPEMPVDFQSQADVRVKLPHAITTSLHTASLMASKRPTLKRLPLGAGFAPQQRSTRVEQWVNAELTALEQQNGPIWKPLISGLFNQGELALLSYPVKAHWEAWPAFSGDDGAPLMQYQRDTKDRAPDDPYYTTARDAPKRAFKLDGDKSKSAYDSSRDDWKSRRIPLVARVVPAEQCVPIFGPGFRLDALIVRSDYTEDSLLLNGYRWFGGATNASHPSSGRSVADSQSSMTSVHSLTEVWTPGNVTYYIGPPGATGKDGTVTYSGTNYDGVRRVANGTEYEASIDLDAEFGLKNLLATYVYGMHFPDEEDPDRRGVPFLWPFLSSLSGLQNLATAHMAYAWRWAYLGPLIQPDHDLPAGLLVDEDGRPRTIKLETMKATIVPGTVASSLPMQAGPDVDKMTDMLMGAWREETPNAQGQGQGTGDPSGHAQVVSRSLTADAYGFVMGDSDDYSGALGAWRWLGQTQLECGTAVANKFGEGVPVYTSESTDDGFRKKQVVLSADSCEGTWDLDANYPPVEGENLPLAQMMGEWVLQGLLPRRKFLETGLGDPTPEQTIVETEAEKFLFTTPQGQQVLASEIAAELGDQKEQEAYALQQKGQMTADGTPTAATQGLPPPTAPGGQGVLPGTAPANPTNSAVGGIVAGGIGSGPATNDAQAVMAQGAIPQ